MRLLALATAFLASGCALSAEGELPDVEVTRHGVQIPGVPVESRIPMVSVPVTFNPEDQLTLDGSAYRAVKVRRVVFKANGARGDLSSLRVLRMTIAGNKGYATGAKPIEILRYQRGADAGAGVTTDNGPVLDLTLSPAVDILPAWRDPPCVLTLEVQGSLPQEAWTADVTVDFAVTVGL
jgi:hypothetical protein